MHGAYTGRILGRFRVAEPLGSGGMGVVYAADDLSLGRRVAVKLLQPELVGDPVRRQRFLREAQSAAAVTHPNIAAVYDIGESDGLVYIVMEYVQGESLRTVLARGRLRLTHALELGANLADAVARAHAAGVIHRDLKPENLMLDHDGRLKILDFGIAKLDPTSSLAAQQAGAPVTHEGMPIGTPGYMSPEQVRGIPVDVRTDIFSFGVILYEMLTGRSAFVGNTPMDVIVATTRDDPPPASSLDPRVPPRVASLIAHCMAKDPLQRPSSMGVLAEELRRLASEMSAVELGRTAAPGSFELATAPVFPTPSAPIAPTLAEMPAATPFAGARSLPPRTSSSAGLLLALAAVGLVALLALVGGGLYLGRARVATATAATSASAPPSLDEPKLGLAAIERWSSRKDEKGEASNTAPAWEAAAADFARVSGSPSAPKRWRAAEPFSRGQAQVLRGELDAAEKSFRSALGEDAAWALPHIGLASVYERRRDQAHALEESRRAEQLDPSSWLAVRQAARSYLITSDFNSAIQELQRADKLSPKNALLLGDLALAYHGAHMDDEATRYANLALALDDDLGRVHTLLAERALEAGQAKSALEHASRAVAVEPDNVSAWLAKADALALSNRGDEAKRAYTEALELAKKTKVDGAPVARLEAVKRALDAGRLPAPRGREQADVPRTSKNRTSMSPKPDRTSKNDSSAGF